MVKSLLGKLGKVIAPILLATSLNVNSEQVRINSIEDLDFGGEFVYLRNNSQVYQTGLSTRYSANFSFTNSLTGKPISANDSVLMVYSKYYPEYEMSIPVGGIEKKGFFQYGFFNKEDYSELMLDGMAIDETANSSDSGSWEVYLKGPNGYGVLDLDTFVITPDIPSHSVSNLVVNGCSPFNITNGVYSLNASGTFAVNYGTTTNIETVSISSKGDKIQVGVRALPAFSKFYIHDKSSMTNNWGMTYDSGCTSTGDVTNVEYPMGSSGFFKSSSEPVQN